MRRACWSYVAVCCVPLGWYLWLPEPTRDIAYDLMALSAVAAILVGAVRNDVRPRAPWYLFAGAQACTTVADTLWNIAEARYGEVPAPSVIDAFYLASYPLMIAGIVLLLRVRGWRGQSTIMIDSLIAATGLGVVIWTLIQPSIVDPALSLDARLVNLAYPTGDLALLMLATRLAIGPGRRSVSFGSLVASLVLIGCADLVYLVTSAAGAFPNGSVPDLLWLLGYVAFGASALHPTMRRLAVPTLEEARQLSGSRIVMIATSMLAVPAILAVVMISARLTDMLVLIGGSTALSLLLLARVVGAVRKLEDVAAEHRRSERRFRSIVHASSDVMFIVRPDRTITWCGDSVERICGYRPTELLGWDVARMLHPDDAEIADQLADSVTIPGSTARTDCRLRMADGSYRLFEVTGQNLLGDPAVDGLVLTGLDVTERRALSDQLHQRAFYDQLTGLANRELLVDRLQQALDSHGHGSATAVAGTGRVALLLVDLDDFKTVNASLGHTAGDQLLGSVADRLRTTLRSTDTAARLGGDEFAVLLTDADGARAEETAKRLIAALREPFPVADQEVFVQASVGVADSDGELGGPEHLLRNAGIAMYQAKVGGKNRHAVYRPSMHADAVARLELQGDLQRAVERFEFIVFYQPIVDLGTGLPVSFEALSRWRHPSRGILGPDRFIPLAEETGIIVPLGRRVLEEACRQTVRWQQRFGRPLAVAVNVSARQLADDSLPAAVSTALERSGLRPSGLTLELTESAVMTDIDRAVRQLQAVRSLGVRIAIDDFGTGYSSLAYLDRLPVDTIKIDRSFVSALDDTDREPTLVTIMIDLARRLDIPVVAEGIERSSQLAKLRQLGCPLGQGYIFSPPADPRRMSQILAEWDAAPNGDDWHTPTRVAGNGPGPNNVVPDTRRGTEEEESWRPRS